MLGRSKADSSTGFLVSLISRILGRTLASNEEAGQRIGPLAGVPA